MAIRLCYPPSPRSRGEGEPAIDVFSYPHSKLAITHRLSVCASSMVHWGGQYCASLPQVQERNPLSRHLGWENTSNHSLTNRQKMTTT